MKGEMHDLLHFPSRPTSLGISLESAERTCRGDLGAAPVFRPRIISQLLNRDISVSLNQGFRFKEKEA